MNSSTLESVGKIMKVSRKTVKIVRGIIRIATCKYKKKSENKLKLTKKTREEPL
jgi:hypothetical protein